MTTQFQPEMNEQDRIVLLQETATNTRHATYDAPLTDEEIENRKSDYFVTDGKILELQDQKKDLVKDLTDQIKDLKSVNAAVRREIREGCVKKEGILYDCANYENGMMETFDKSGDMVESRRLTPDEKKGQSRLFIPNRKTA